MSNVKFQMSLKKVGHFYFYRNFGKHGPIFIIIYCKIQKGSAEEDGIKTITSP